MLSLATLDEFQRPNRDDETDEGSPCAKRTLCSRKRRDKRRVLEQIKQLNADPETKYVTFELLLHAAFVADEISGDMLEPARKRCQSTQLTCGERF